MVTSLLCSFCTEDSLDTTLKQIVNTYEIVFESIYVLENIDTPGNLCCTYNVPADTQTSEALPATISLHRKKATNTLYTINAVNIIVAELNGGILDKSTPVPWEQYRNSILVTAYGKLKRINTKLRTIVKVHEVA